MGCSRSDGSSCPRVFLYNLTVESGQLEIIKSSISSLSTDRRLQALLIAYCFSAFMEGTAGLGAPVAVCAAMLIGIGFPPFAAAVVCLVGNTQPVPFGPLGVPTLMMASVTKSTITSWRGPSETTWLCWHW